MMSAIRARRLKNFAVTRGLISLHNAGHGGEGDASRRIRPAFSVWHSPSRAFEPGSRCRFTRVRKTMVLLLILLGCLAGPMAQAAHAGTTVDQFVANTMGKVLSNAAGTERGECVSLVSQYLLQVYGINNTGWNANAIDYQAGGNGGNHLAANGFSWSTNQSFANGDILVWGQNAAAGTGPLGHVGIWYGGKVYDQNDGRHSPSNVAGYSSFWTGGYLGHWRKATVPPDGAFVKLSSSATVYVIAGAAPLAVSTWSAVGGSHPVTVLTQAQFDALRPYPRNGTFLNAAGTVYETAGGAPIYVSSWSAIGGSKPCITIDPWDIAHITRPEAHLCAVPVNGTFVKASNSATVYRIAGGAPLGVSNWAAVGGSHPYVTIDPWDLANITSAHAHMNAVPSNGTFVNAVTATGAEYGSYVIAGGAPLYISTWSVYGGQPAGVVGIDAWDIQHPTSAAAHLKSVPANGTFINARTADGTEVGSYVIAGGAPIAISSWSLYGGRPAGLVQVDAWDVQNITNPAAHLNAKPIDGTLVEGLPSHVYWFFVSGYRNPAAASSAAVQADDIGLAAFPVASTPDTVGPTTFAKAASGRKGHVIFLRYKVTDDRSATAVSTCVVIRNAKGNVAKRFSLGTRTIATWHRVKWTPRAKGTYRYYIYAKDLAGNTQSKVGSAKVTVR